MTNENQLTLAELNRQKSTEKVKSALNKMKKDKVPINIKSVSETAKVSRKTIYNRQDLKLMIEEAALIQFDLTNSKKTTESKPRRSVQEERIDKLRERNKQLVKDKKAILEQNMILTKENNTLKRRLYDLEEFLQLQRNSKVTPINKNI